MEIIIILQLVWTFIYFLLVNILLQYFEQDDPDLYLTKVKYILEHDVEDMDLYFVEEDYDQSGQLTKVKLTHVEDSVLYTHPSFCCGT